MYVGVVQTRDHHGGVSRESYREQGKVQTAPGPTVALAEHK